MRALILALPLLLLACAKEPAPVPQPPPAAPPPPPSPVTTAPPPPATPWEDAAHTPGDWVYRSDARGSVALFGPKGTDARFIVRCDRQAGQIYLSRLGRAEGDKPTSIEIRTTSGVRSFAARSNGDTPAYLAVALPPREAHLDAMAFSRGRFLVRVKGSDDLIVPNWPEMTRVIEDCRS